jgi:hypothetical protein
MFLMMGVQRAVSSPTKRRAFSGLESVNGSKPDATNA